jgi:hypothetical protein
MLFDLHPIADLMALAISPQIVPDGFMSEAIVLTLQTPQDSTNAG